MSELDDLKTRVETYWGEHDAARGPLRAELVQIVEGLEGVTGLSAGAGANRLVDVMLDFAEFHADVLVNASKARTDALMAETQRDEWIASQPPEEVPPEPSQLEGAEHFAAREWLRGANDAQVSERLTQILDRPLQLEWARRLMDWARADGTTAQVLAAINAVIGSAPNPVEVPNEPPVSGVGPTSTYAGEGDAALADANPANEPAPDAPVDEIVAWVGSDIDRARVMYDAETNRAEGSRPEVLAALVDVLDTDTPPLSVAENAQDTADPTH